MESFRPETIPNPNTSKEPRSKPFRVLFDILETVILSLLLFIGIDAVTARIRVDGQSMEPTLQSGEFVIVNKLAYKLSAPELSDVIVFHYPRDPKIEYIKRVIGLPGDVVKITNGSVLVNEPLHLTVKDHYWWFEQFASHGYKIKFCIGYDGLLEALMVVE